MSRLGRSTSLEEMIQSQLIRRGIQDPRVIEALRSVPRDRFFPEAIRKDAFSDQAAPIGHGQTISQPYMVGLMTHELDLQPNHRVLEIGTGSGYQTAILARLAAEIYTIERVKPLLDAAWEQLMDLHIRNVHYRHGDGTTGWPEFAPFDRILIAAAAPQMPQQLLLSQLSDGGKAVLPIGQDDQQILVRITRDGDKLQMSDVCHCRFVRLIGQEGWQEDEETRGLGDKGTG